MSRPAPGHVDLRTLHRGGEITVVDWRCRPSSPTAGGVETSTADALVFPRRGAFVRHAAGRARVAHPGLVFFFPRGAEYRVSHPLAGGDRCTVLALSESVLEALVGRGTGHGPPHLSRDAAPLTASGALLLKRLGFAAEDGPGLELEETALLLAVEALAAWGTGGIRRRGCHGRSTSATNRRAVEIARLVMAARFRGRLGLDEIARATGLSTYHLCRIFRAETGATLHRYLNRLRLLAALDALAPGVGLTRVALEVGFSSHSHFTAAFRREFGAPPSRILREIRADEIHRMRDAVARKVRPARR